MEKPNTFCLQVHRQQPRLRGPWLVPGRPLASDLKSPDLPGPSFLINKRMIPGSRDGELYGWSLAFLSALSLKGFRVALLPSPGGYFLLWERSLSPWTG